MLAHRSLGCFQCLRQFTGVFATGLSHVGSAATTAAGFLSFATSGAQSFARFGVIAALVLIRGQGSGETVSELEPATVEGKS